MSKYQRPAADTAVHPAASGAYLSKEAQYRSPLYRPHRSLVSHALFGDALARETSLIIFELG